MVELTGTMQNDEPSMKLSALSMEVAIACGRRQPINPGPMYAGFIKEMLHTARTWELEEKTRQDIGAASTKPPFHQSVMNMLARINESRVEAQRAEMRRRLDHNLNQAKIAKRREAFKPKVSRRVLNERAERRRQASDQDRSREEGPDQAATTGAEQ